MVTFGSPRVGNLKFAEKFNAEFGQDSERVTQGVDPIINMPPKDTQVCI